MRFIVAFLSLILCLAILFGACSTPTKQAENSGNARRALDAYYLSNDVVKYLLPETPNWANNSINGHCHRNETIRYFDLNRLSSNYNLSYLDALQAQINFNLERQNVLQIARLAPNYKSSIPLGLPPKEEETLFYQALDRVQAKLYSLKVPTFKRINLLWIDPLLIWPESEGATIGLKKGMAQRLLSHSWASSGHPVVISFCLTANEIEKILEAEKMAEHNIKFLGSETMSPYDTELKIVPGPKIFLNGIFSTEQELHFFSREKYVPAEIEGKLIPHDLAY